MQMENGHSATYVNVDVNSQTHKIKDCFSGYMSDCIGTCMYIIYIASYRVAA